MTKTFETEAEAKDFARTKFDEGLVVFAGTLNPFLPRRLITSSSVPQWLDDSQEQQAAKPDDGARAKEK